MEDDPNLAGIIYIEADGRGTVRLDERRGAVTGGRQPKETA
ncbi:MAG: hypothetical protein ACMUJM_08505 [bacterium]